MLYIHYLIWAWQQSCAMGTRASFSSFYKKKFDFVHVFSQYEFISINQPFRKHFWSAWKVSDTTWSAEDAETNPGQSLPLRVSVLLRELGEGIAWWNMSPYFYQGKCSVTVGSGERGCRQLWKESKNLAFELSLEKSQVHCWGLGGWRYAKT